MIGPVLRGLGVGLVLIGLLHALIGGGADSLLGATGPFDATRDSQNRYYGAAYMAHGLLLWVATGNLARYRPVVTCLLGVTFVGGLSRLMSIAVMGPPAPMIYALLATELLLPPVLWWWLARTPD